MDLRRRKPYTIGFYTFIEQIGQGGFSEVYLVKHRNYNNYFVAKAIRTNTDDSDVNARGEIFATEVKALSGLDHPHIIRLYDHFVLDNLFYLVLEYCPNGSLHDEALAHGRIKISRFYDISREIVDALAYCHQNGVAHRDIKPGNVLIDSYNRTKIADFGICAKTNSDELTEHFSGSLSYLAPEIFQKKPHNAMMADVWALGVTFATILLGRSPWPSDSIGGLKKLIASAKYRLSSRIPDIIQDLISKMIVVEPSERLTMKQIQDHPFFQPGPNVPRRRFTPKIIIPSLKKSLIEQLEDKGDKRQKPLRSAISFISHNEKPDLILQPRFQNNSNDNLMIPYDDIVKFS